MRLSIDMNGISDKIMPMRSFSRVGVLCFCILAGLLSPCIAADMDPSANERPEVPGAESPEFMSIVLLLKQPRDVTKADFEAACTAALRKDAKELKWIDSAPAPAKFVIAQGEHGIALLQLGKPYVEDPEALAKTIDRADLKKIILEHKAWLSIDLLGKCKPAEADAAFRDIARIAAELLKDDCIGIYNVETSRLVPIDDKTKERLQGEDPYLALGGIHPERQVLRKPDDAELAKAAAEAKRRFPEFVAAFKNRKPSQGFTVKAPMATSKPNSKEHIWITVTEIGEKEIKGTLENDPFDIPGKKYGDPVTVAVDDLEDWCIFDGDKRIGAFSVKVLEERAK